MHCSVALLALPKMAFKVIVRLLSSLSSCVIHLIGTTSVASVASRHTSICQAVHSIPTWRLELARPFKDTCFSHLGGFGCERPWEWEVCSLAFLQKSQSQQQWQSQQQQQPEQQERSFISTLFTSLFCLEVVAAFSIRCHVLTSHWITTMTALDAKAATVVNIKLDQTAAAAVHIRWSTSHLCHSWHSTEQSQIELVLLS